MISNRIVTEILQKLGYEREVIGGLMLYEIRDPIHISIPFDDSERAIIDHPFVQRLRRIRQLGFAQYPFPGATHTRFAHSVGAMHLSGKAFDILFRDTVLSDQKRSQFRYCVRMAALLHDVGHGPFSHATEFAFPNVNTVLQTDENRQATHEDYTIAIILQSTLVNLIAQNFDFSADHVACLIDSAKMVPDDFFMEHGLDYRPLFSQLVSSNLDMDRSDYLVRDSFFTGVKYGQVDVSWLHNHLAQVILPNDMVGLGLERRASYALDHFLISRYHMFLMVYFHKKATAFELLFQQYMTDPECQYLIPSNLEDYLYTDDADAFVHLRKSRHPLAQKLINQDVHKVVFEIHGLDGVGELSLREMALREANIPVWPLTHTGSSFSKTKPTQPPIYLMESVLERKGTVPMYSLSSAFDQAKFQANISRLYVQKEDFDRALLILQKLDIPQGVQQTLL